MFQKICRESIFLFKW